MRPHFAVIGLCLMLAAPATSQGLPADPKCETTRECAEAIVVIANELRSENQALTTAFQMLSKRLAALESPTITEFNFDENSDQVKVPESETAIFCAISLASDRQDGSHCHVFQDGDVWRVGVRAEKDTRCRAVCMHPGPAE